MDSFQWNKGYTEKYGLIKVDFEKNERTRTPKDSAYFYADLISNNGFPENWNKDYNYPGKKRNSGLVNLENSVHMHMSKYYNDCW